MEYFAKGKHGRVYLDKHNAIKKSSPLRIKNEVKWLKTLNKNGIGPKLISYNKNSFKYKFIKGEFITEFIEKNNKSKIRKILLDILKQCRVMDKLNVNKKEMHHPDKHIIIRKGEAVFIDFERSKLTENPKNVTQFCQYILKLSGMFPRKIKVGKEKMVEVMKYYKKEQSEKSQKRRYLY